MCKAAEKFLISEKFHEYFTTVIKIADSYRQKGEFDEALDILEEIEKSPGFVISDTNDIIIDFYFVKGSAHGDKGQYKIADELISNFIDLCVNRYGPYDSLVSYGYNNLGSYSYFMGDYERSIASFRKALEIVEYNSDDEINEDIAMYSMNIGIILASTNKLEEANKFFQRALKINEQILEEYDPALATLHLNIGRNEMLQSHYEAALEHYELAESIYIGAFGADYPSLGTLYLNMGNIFNNKQDFEKALEYYKKAYQLVLSRMDADHPVLSRH
jgi:tetratricopeptide (TPR) repeat protein